MHAEYPFANLDDDVDLEYFGLEAPLGGRHHGET